MSQVTAVLTLEPGTHSSATAEAIAASPVISRVLVFGPPQSAVDARFTAVEGEFASGDGLSRALEAASADYLLVVLPGERVQLRSGAIERLLAVAQDSGAAITYSDFADRTGTSISEHPLIDYQLGSIRDDFDFGPVLLISKRAAEAALRRHGPIDKELKWGALYDLRLKLSADSPMIRVPEPLYERQPADTRDSGDRQFDYVDPRRRDYQLEMESLAAAHLKRIGAYLPPVFKSRPRATGGFPVRASVVIPVRNRERTIRDAVISAVSQKTNFEFNVIVVDNHSTDRTSAILAELARDFPKVVHMIPARTDLGIGGCWNEAIYSPYCGEVAVQLDSDDLYRDEQTLQTLVAKLDEGPYVMVIGSYTIVDFSLQELPPGLVDHSEWTRTNGHNNALRINGLGAPRVFYVPVLRRFGFPNTSYGEDYAVGLRVSREYEIGRVMESVYYARRWEGNSDAGLDRATANRYDAYKDRLRTIEILARQRMNQGELE